MQSTPKPPETYDSFVERFPKLAVAWDMIGEAGKSGPFDEKTIRLIKLAVAIGAMRQGAVHASIRKATYLGISREEIEQVIALSAGTLGLPSTVAIYSWIKEVFDQEP